MESKLKKLDSLTKLDYNGYQKLLKASWADLLGVEEVGFAIIEGSKLPWKNATDKEKEEQPLLYLGPLTKWKTELNGSKDLELVNYSYGSCKVVQVGKDMHVYMVPAKGKATDEKHLKGIKKALKKFKPKVFLEVVSDLSTVEHSEVEVRIDENTSIETEFHELGQELEKYHRLTNKIKKAMEGAEPAERSKLQIKYKQVLNRLKNLCMNWKEDILPHAAELITEEPGITWAKIYQKWNGYFEKREAAKEGKSDDKEGRQLEEERLYTKTLEDLDQFFTAIEHSQDLDPSVIEVDLENLKTHVESWKTFIGVKESNYSAELEAVETQMQNLEVEWGQYQPLLKRYHKANSALQAAIEADDAARIARLTKSVNQAIQQLNNL
ncbi:MAG: hypothetical protein ACRBFS_00995 [Aureispira sp.]